MFSTRFSKFYKISEKIARIFRNVGASTWIEIQVETSNFTGLSSENSIFSRESKISKMVKTGAQNQGRDHQLRYYPKFSFELIWSFQLEVTQILNIIK